MLTKNDISDQLQPLVTTQDYSPRQVIAGVEVKGLNRFTGDGGSFAEVFRMGSGQVEGFSDFEAKQISYSVVPAGIIKGFHLHYKQDDLWFVLPESRMLVVLVDVRKGSSTEGVVSRYFLGDGKAHLLRIPKGVAHGCRNLGTADGGLLYATSEQFNLEAPDEQRLPHDHFGAEVWEVEIS